MIEYVVEEHCVKIYIDVQYYATIYVDLEYDMRMYATIYIYGDIYYCTTLFGNA